MKQKLKFTDFNFCNFDVCGGVIFLFVGLFVLVWSFGILLVWVSLIFIIGLNTVNKMHIQC